MFKFGLLLSMLMIALEGFSQERTLQLRSSEGAEHFRYSDPLALEDIKRQWLSEQRSAGYLEAGIDGCTQDGTGDSLHCEAYLGPRYNSLSLDSHNLPEPFLKESIRSLSINDFSRISSQIIRHFENRGHPFVSLQLLHARAEDGILHAALFFDRGPHVVYDSILINGQSQLSQTFLASYLNLRKGADYREVDIKAIDRRLRNLPLVKLRRPSRIQFLEGVVLVELNIDPQVTDRLDGVVGLAPNTSNANDQLLITGELNIELNNLFQRAGAIQMHWRNYLQRSQQLDLQLAWPYLLGSRFGINTRFDLNKYDSLYVNLRSHLGVRYQQFANNYLELYYAFERSSLLTVDTNTVRQQQRLPTGNPYRIDNYGLRVHQQRIDYLPNPRKGLLFSTDVSLGVRQLGKNTLIDQVRWEDPRFPEGRSIYDTIESRSYRARLEMNLQWFLPLGRNGSLVNSWTSKLIWADQIMLNEYFFLGGYNDLQGFDENSFLSNAYVVYRLEYRYLFATNGHIGAFINTAWIDDRENGTQDIPYGFGLSTHLQTGNSILRIAYALGSQQGNPISMRSGKIHFGLVNYF